MKQENVGGTKIIQALVKGSKSFQQKTQFSQEKYLKKKAKK